ncbi:hypothetical protein HYC85_029719 [Camellia sinensis]|uniref:Uncharacterized protein n=1 Tax=Camellia sinensis TaxID=4442 RepID=A0A7J7G1A6_CAMSI|nr:hypothetical protein HYC85_029719 [Camellia sinensis]
MESNVGCIGENTGIRHGDMRSGYGRSLFEPLLQLILGHDVSGEVAAIGASEVFGALYPTAIRDTYTNYAIPLEDELTTKPVSISHVFTILPVKCYSDAFNYKLQFHGPFINFVTMQEASAIPFAPLTA